MIAALAMLVASVVTGTALAVDGDAAGSDSTQTAQSVADDAGESGDADGAATVGETADDAAANSGDAVSGAGDAEVSSVASDGVDVSGAVSAVVDGPGSFAVSVPVLDGDDAGAIGVTVDVPEGAFDGGVTLLASMVADDDGVVADALADADITYDGLLALDVRFEDADGVEVEPVQPVGVTFELPAGALGGDVDASSIVVSHLVEDADGNITSVDTMADAGDVSDGTVTLDGATTLSADTEVSDSSTVTMEFTVDSFSTFTIRWNYSNSLTVYIIDTDGNEIETSNISAVNISSATSIATIRRQINESSILANYEFVKAVVSNGASNAVSSGTQVQRIRYQTSGSWNNNNGWQYSTQTSGNSWQNIDNNNRLYLVYDPSATTCSGITFQYYSTANINDNETAADRCTVKYTIVLVDENGEESYDLPAGSTLPDGGVSSFPNDDTVYMNAAVFAQMGISIPGYTFENGYAYFYWEGNFKGYKVRVSDFHNFYGFSDRYSNNYDSYIGFTGLKPDDDGDYETESSNGYEDYYQKSYGDEGYGYYAYNPTGTLRIVFQKVSKTVQYHANFVDAYGVTQYQLIDTTEMSMAQDNDGVWYGTLAEVTDTVPTKAGYMFVGWYDGVDEDGNGTGNLIAKPADDTGRHYADATYYARWELNLDVDVKAESPDISKYVEDNEDGTYDLSLSVTGTTVKEEKKLNVLYILDESYSMMWDMDGSYPLLDNDGNSNTQGDKYYYYASSSGMDQPDSTGKGPIPYSYERFQAALNAIRLMNGVLDGSDMLDVEYALVEFAPTASSSNWSEDGVSLPAAEYGTFASGTNYMAAFNSAASLLNDIDADRSDAETVVVFITDGEPNRPTDSTAKTAAAEALGLLSGDSFYAVGVGSDIGNEYLSDLVESATGFDTTGAFQSGDASEIATYFAKLAAELAGSVVSDAVIVDELSEYAQLTNTAASPTITITDAGGAPVTVTSNNDGVTDSVTGVYTEAFTFSDYKAYGDADKTDLTLTYTYYPAGQYTYADGTNTYPVITLAFPEGYQLTQYWTYTITVRIEPTETAYGYESTEEDEEQRDGYPHVGDENTDADGNTTSSGQPGFHSNTEASLTYQDADGESHEMVYPHPVIQVTVRPVSSLPLTGGGTTLRNLLIVGGVLVLLAGGAWLLSRRRRV